MRQRRLSFGVMALPIVLSACGESGESAEEAHDRGYQDGFADGLAAVCDEVGKFSGGIWDTLRGEKIC